MPRYSVKIAGQSDRFSPVFSRGSGHFAGAASSGEPAGSRAGCGDPHLRPLLRHAAPPLKTIRVSSRSGISSSIMKSRWLLLTALCCLVLTALFNVESAAAPFRGNTKSHVFHQGSCRYYTCTNCTAKFATAREALDHGYRPCGICEPGDLSRRETSSEGKAAYVGNTNSHKFHRNSCRYAGCTNCTAKFSSRDEAIKAGYAPGGCCKP